MTSTHGSESTRVVSVAQARAMTTRPDLLRSEAEIVRDRRITWNGRLAEMGDYGFGGGSALDRRLIIEGMAALETEHRRA